MILRNGLVALCAASMLAATSLAAQAADLVRLGEGPFITGGGYYIAEAKGYFKKLGIEVQPKMYIDGAMAVPSLISGELDVSFMAPNAGLFNSIAKGAPIVLILDRGNNKRGFGYTAINVTQDLHNAGVKSLADFAKLKGKRIGLGATGSINQYLFARGLQKAGLDPRKDVQWITNIPQPDLMKMLGQKQVDATDLAYQFGYFAQKNNWGPMVAVDDEIDPDGAVAVYATRKQFVQQHRDVLVRFAMAYLQGVKEFDAAVVAPDKHPDIVDILAKRTALQKPELVRAIAPHWSYTNEDGIPNVKSVMAQQDYWADYFHLVEKKVPESALFDLSIAHEAKARLDREKPFGQ
ncbi:MAG TPA: ABC transporter substrate-binding protein [Pseudolabrys sp.]|jgi:NitT/TauT family transport system substrate-binding protein|uniref:ABC transporter substrate-binding protein n=1 Tax=Pseudolabrys sp. TaxID=1960880 RepID=UPI002B58FC59|nr:ABC transporter substrate-binding protein [Pseudolabrys sp.]HEV2627363.1 ABC transporter substrate-binding protein [Pseudolabrys sp.]HTJ02875.1 ABC transporter substrate-binding protein [Methylovirgula sp.]